MIKPLVQKPLSKIPLGYLVNNRLQIARGSHDVSLVRQRIPGVIGFLDLILKHKDITGARVLEYGTGWGALNAFILSLYGAKQVLAVDHLPHLTFSLARNYLSAIGAELDPIARSSGRNKAELQRELEVVAAAGTLEDMLDRARIEYVAPFDLTATRRDEASFDMVYSYAVKAHLPEPVLIAAAAEAKRILAPGGIVAHWIGLQDPYNALNGGHRVDFLKYSEPVWKFLNHNSAQHNNRLRASQHRAVYETLQGQVLEYKAGVDEAGLARLKTMKVDRRFAGLDDKDLATVSLALVVRF